MATPALPVSTPAAAPPVTPAPIHIGLEDKLASMLAARATAAAPPESAVVQIPPGGIQNPPLTAPAAPQVPSTTAPAAASPEAPAVPAEPAAAQPPTIDDLIENLDFDAPPAPDVAEPSAAPEIPISESADEPWKQLQQAVEKGALPEEVEAALLRTSRGKKILETFKISRELEKPEADGGIGHYPTVEEIRQGNLALQDVTWMRQEFENNPLSFIANLFVPNQEGVTAMGTAEQAARAVSAIPHVFRESGRPDLVNALANPLFTMFFDHQYQTVLSMPEETPEQIAEYRKQNQIAPQADQKYRMLDGLRVAEHMAMGRARELPGLTTPPASGRSVADSPEYQQMRQQLEQANERITQYDRSHHDTVISNLRSANQTAVSKDVGTLLNKAGLDKFYPADVLGPFSKEMVNLIHSKVMGTAGQAPANPYGLQQFNQQVQAALRNGGDTSAARDTYVKLFRDRLRTDPEVRSRIQKLVASAKTRADANLVNAQSAQRRSEPAGSGSPAPASVVAPASQKTRQPGESKMDHLANLVSEAMSRSRQ